jgi:hypothetical protein
LYSELERILLGIPKRDVVQMMGDFNERVGPANEDLDHSMKKHGVGVMNENGKSN